MIILLLSKSLRNLLERMAGALFEFDQRLQDMRTQQLNFGPEFCLCIPDADDVKAAFGHMATIIFKQQTELSGVHSSIKKMTDEFLRSQTELVNWTKRNLQELKDENRDLRSKIDECQSKLDIFAYNLQGFDESLDNVQKEVGDLSSAGQNTQIELPASLIDGLFASIETKLDAKANVNKAAEKHEEKVAAKHIPKHTEELTLPPVDLELLKKKEALEKEALKSLHTPKVTSRRPSKLGTIVETESEAGTSAKDRARKRWKWAYRMIKMSKMGGLVKKVPKGQSLFQRVDRLENALYTLEKKMTAKVEAAEQNAAAKVLETLPTIVDTFTPKVEEKVEKFQQIDPKIIEELEKRNEKTQFEVQELNEKLSSLNLELNQVSSVVRTQEVQIANAKNSPQVPADLEAKVTAVVEKLKNSTQVQHMMFETVVTDLVMKMQTAEKDLIEAENKVTALTKAALSKEEMKSVIEILKNDTDLREARGQLSVIESTLLALNYIVKTVTQNITSAASSNEDLSEDDTELFEGMITDCGNVSRSLDSANNRLKVQYDLCRFHDKAVAERWSTLTTTNDMHGQLLDAFSSAMRAFSKELEERPSIDKVQKLVDNSMVHVKKGLQEEITGTVDRLMLKMKIKLVEQETVNEMTKQSKSGNNDQNDEAAAAHFEGMLEPLISDIVEFYVQRAATPQQQQSMDDEGNYDGQGDSGYHPKIRFSDVVDQYGQRPGGGQSRMLARKQQEEALKNLKDELAQHTQKIEDLANRKNDMTEVQNLLASKADAFELANKADSRVLETVEKTLRKVMEDLGDLRNLKDSELDKVKGTLEKHVKAKLITLFSRMEDNAKPAFLSTKSLCLSCARTSSVKVHSEPSNPVGFLPALGHGSTPGPEVYRAGFKMPVSSRDGLFSSRSGVIVSSVPDELLGMDMEADELRVEPSAKSEGAPSPSLPPPNSSKQTKRTPKVITHGGGREDTQMVQPMHRPGLRGKKSDRAAFMAANSSRTESVISLESSAGSPGTNNETDSLMLGSTHSRTMPPSYGQKSKFLAPVRTTTAS